MQEENVTRISIDLIVPNSNQPRKKFDENSLKELALSIREYGIINPILVRKKDNLYEIIAGERRYRAAKLLELPEIPVIIRNDITDEKVAEIALIENLQRENITAIEEAKSYQEILAKTNITEEKLSEMIGKSQSFIANKLRLLKLPSNIQDALINKKISERHARSLLKVNEEDKQNELLNRIITEKLTVKELDAIINETKINEEEIHSAINDLMKSLNIKEEKEEKESDNMNNGSFFPNYNTNQEINNNMNLNNMNMQTMNQNQGVTAPNPEMPAAPIFNMNAEPVPSVPTQPMPGPMQMPAAPVIPTPQVPNIEESFVVEPTQNNQINPITEGTMPIETSPVEPTAMPQVDIPLFNDQSFTYQPNINTTPEMNSEVNNNPINTQPEMVQNPLPAASSVTPPVVDAPLFNQSQPMPNSDILIPTPEAIPTVDAQSNLVTPTQPVEQDKLTQVKDLLNNNGIQYKLYSNETGHCIIIEL